MSHYKRSGQMDMTDRAAIETCLCKVESFYEIAKRIENALLMCPMRFRRTAHT